LDRWINSRWFDLYAFKFLCTNLPVGRRHLGISLKIIEKSMVCGLLFALLVGVGVGVGVDVGLGYVA